MNMNDILEQRRSIYSLGNEVSLSNQEIIERIEHTLARTPSAFNAQTQRVLLLLDKEHELFWNETLKLLLPLSENKEKTTNKINSFIKAKGTILFYDDSSVTKALEEKFPLYSKNVNVWALEQSGMLQMNVWNVLTSLGLGASLQHYNEVIDTLVRDLFDVSPDWRLIGQMPFGSILSVPDKKHEVPVKSRILVRV
ncbi:MAG: nitroreductase family protein [Candidatus Izemoplasmatales bacterium]